MVCLDIPLPRCVQNLVKEPPVCLPSVKDIQAVDLIRQFGKEFRKPENEIEKACSLASGPSDLVVLLERPHARQTYEQSFGVFVKDCPTLEAVDELLRYGSDGARSIHTVTILDAFSFEPRKLPPGSSPPKDFIPEERCHQLIEDILKLKGPKVVLCCWGKQNPCENELVFQFRSDGVGKWPFRHEIKIGESHTIAIRSFHPSCAVNYNKSENACLRTLLVCHFTLAFAELSGSSTVPEWMEVVCKDSKKAQNGSGNDKNGGITPSVGSHTILRKLQMMGRKAAGSRREYNGKAAKRLYAERQRQKVDALLRQLFASNYNGGSRDIAELCLLWRGYKPDEKPAYDPVNRLIELGSRQDVYHCHEADSTLLRAFNNYPFEFEQDDDDAVAAVEQRLGSLSIHENTSSFEYEDVTIETLQKLLHHWKHLFGRLESLAAKMVSHIQLSVELQITIDSDDRMQISKSIAELTQHMYHRLEKATGQIASTVSFLTEEDMTSHKKQLARLLVQHLEASEIRSSVMLEVEIVSNQAFRCNLLCSGLLSPRTFLLGPSQGSNDGVTETLVDVPKGLEALLVNVKSILDTFTNLQKQLISPE